MKLLITITEHGGSDMIRAGDDLVICPRKDTPKMVAFLRGGELPEQYEAKKSADGSGFLYMKAEDDGHSETA